MTLQVAKEPEGLLVQRADVLAWIPGLTVDRWNKLRRHLKEVRLPGFTKPFYRKSEIKTKLVQPMLEGKL